MEMSQMKGTKETLQLNVTRDSKFEVLLKGEHYKGHY